MHYLNANQYTYISGEINALYHEAAVKAGISDSVQNILYVICEKENRCEIENKIWSEWTEEEQQQYIALTKKYRDSLKRYMETML